LGLFLNLRLENLRGIQTNSFCFLFTRKPAAELALIVIQYQLSCFESFAWKTDKKKQVKQLRPHSMESTTVFKIDC
jgi:hypothetical protein